jgi:hypothetical protein
MPRPTMTKSGLALARAALHAARRSLPKYSHRFSPKKFTVHQLLAVLAIREFFHLDYRGVEQLLQEWSDLRAVLGLQEVPTYSALCKAEARLLKKTALNVCCNTPSLALENKV